MIERVWDIINTVEEQLKLNSINVYATSKPEIVLKAWLLLLLNYFNPHHWPLTFFSHLVIVKS
jgi:hypothetical protein